MISCHECGAASADQAKFCAGCGARIPGGDGESATRKTVTALFCDVTGSTALAEAHDPEATRAIMARYFASMVAAIERHGGMVQKFIGDAVVAFFGVPLSHEDDALRAVRAALDMQHALTTLNDELEIEFGVQLAARIGVNTGEVIVTGAADTTIATGDAINVAARLEQAAAPGEILIGQATFGLVGSLAEAEPLEPLVMKGKSLPVPAWRVRSVLGPGVTRGLGGLKSPLIGREMELALLNQALARCVADRTGHLVTVLGAAGVGKSRLLEEFTSSLADDVRVLRGRCLSYGDGVGLWPLREMLRSSAGLDGLENDEIGQQRLAGLFSDEPEGNRAASRLATIAGLSGTAPPAEEVTWAARRWTESMGRRTTVILVIDDLHWADQLMLDVVEELTEWVHDAAVLVVCLARPEFLDDQPRWGGGKLNSTTAMLEQLNDAEAELLVGNLVSTIPVPVQLRQRIVLASGGNPLFVEQMLAMFVDDGGSPSQSLDELPIPPSIGALLTARLDRLPATERAALECASVIGQVFYKGALDELTSTDVAPRLRALARKQLIRADRSDIAGEEALQFRHILVRDASYKAIPKARRAELHERFARWLDKRAGAIGGNLDEFVGFHLAEAVGNRRQLGPLDSAGDELAHEAASRLASAAEVLRITDPRATSLLFARAAMLTAGIEQLHYRYRQADALLWTNDARAAGLLLEELVVAAADAGDEDLRLQAELQLIEPRARTDSDWPLERWRRVVDEGLERFSRLKNPRGRITALEARQSLLRMRGQWGPMIALAEEIELLGEEVGDRLVVSQARMMQLAVWISGPTSVREGLRRLDELERRLADSSLILQPSLALTRGFLTALDDRESEARELLSRAKLLADDLHFAGIQVFVAFHTAFTLVTLNDMLGAREAIGRAVGPLEEQGDQGALSTIYPLLAETYWKEGNFDSARRWAEQARDVCAPEDVSAHGWWRAMLAKLEARQGDPDVARQLANEAVDWVERSDEIDGQGFVHAARGETLELLRELDEASRSYQTALDRYERKGNIPSARRLGLRLAALQI